MTVSLIIISTLVFLFTIALPPVTAGKFFYLYGLVPARVLAPEILSLQGDRGARFIPFISSMFLHGNWSHLISNMWALWLFGDNIEDRLGSFRSEEHTSELQSRPHLVCRLLLEKKKKK